MQRKEDALELNLWRAEVEKLTDYFESGKCDDRVSQLAELIYFLGESECDGVGGYMERRDSTVVDSLVQAAEVINSKELLAVLSSLREEIALLPSASEFFDRISSAIEADDKDPFRRSDALLNHSMPEIENQLDRALNELGVIQELGLNLNDQVR